MQMKVLQLQEPGQFIATTSNIPASIPDDYALLKVHNIGICGTDLHAFKGKQPFFAYPRILGHELAVEVVETGKNVTNVQKGDICCVEPYRNPIIGQAVKAGKTNCGEQLTVLGVHEDGGMQEYFVYLAKHLHKFPALNKRQLALIEPLAIGKHAVNRADIQQNDIVLIIGAGPIGLGIFEFASLSGAKVILMDVNEEKLHYCRTKRGIENIILANDNPEAQILEFLDGLRPTIILDATGNSASMHQCFNYAAAGGTIVFVGLFIGDVTFHDPFFHKKELTLKASRAALSSDFIEVGNLIAAGKISPEWMITHELNFDDLPAEFPKLTNSSTLIKALVHL